MKTQVLIIGDDTPEIQQLAYNILRSGDFQVTRVTKDNVHEFENKTLIELDKLAHINTTNPNT